MAKPNERDPVLCYVDMPWCYFTRLALEDEHGDDWNDAPYYCNASPPYGDTMMVAIEADAEAQEDAEPHTYRSVDEINRRTVPWLTLEPYDKESVYVWAGTPLSEFKRLVRKTGGDIYVKEES